MARKRKPRRTGQFRLFPRKAGGFVFWLWWAWWKP